MVLHNLYSMKILQRQISDVRNEYVLQVKGTVVERKDKNPKLETGEIEVVVSEVKIINTAITTPMIIADETDALEDTRLKYRYLDLRRPCLQKEFDFKKSYYFISS